ncbi:MAG: insulinase family protein [Aliiglaciecola sp.]
MLRISSNDKRSFLPTTLPNGLKVLLVSDPICRKSAAATCVHGGHFNDPEGIDGLSHLLEHMLFDGSLRYPDTNGFDQFLSQRGGCVNAWTGTEYSNFHFDVAHEHLEQSLTLFCDLLFYPVFDLQGISREISAIDAEFKLKINDDLRRLYQVHKETCNPAHPFSRFSVGNQQTFSEYSPNQLQKALHNLHNSLYTPENMTLCVISQSSLDDMKNAVEQAFTDVPRKAPVERQSYPPLYLESQLAVLIKIKPIKVARRLIVSFAFPDVQDLFRTKPLEYISHLLGDEGQGSLLWHLKKCDWVTNLSAGGGINGSNFKDFNINMQLTERGLNCLEDILNALFYFIKQINQGTGEQWRFREKVLLGQQCFDFTESAKPIDEATHLSTQMFHYPTEEWLSGDHVVSEPDADIVKKCIAKLTPSNMRLKLVAPDLHTDKVAKWYATPYKVEAIETNLLQRLNSPDPVENLHLPEKNPYICEQLSTQPIEKHNLIPKQIVKQQNIQVWFAQDAQFNQPKGDCFISFDCKAVTQGAAISAYKRLWVAMMSEHLNDLFYQAGVAGLHYHLYAHQGGLTIHTSGFSQKQLQLSRQIFSLLHQDIDLSDRFEQIKNKQINNLQNALLNRPVNRLFTRLSGIVQRYTYPPMELLEYVKDATLEDIYQVKKSLFSDYYIESFLFGDWTHEQACQFAKHIESEAHNSSAPEAIKRDVIDLKNSKRFVNYVDSQHNDAAAVVYLQIPTANSHDVALTILVEQLFATPFFNELRNEKQLGYLVGSGYLPLNQHPGMVFYVQSPDYSMSKLVEEIDLFLNSMIAQIGDFEDIWQHVRRNILKQLVDNDTSLSVKSQRLWLSIGNQDHQFNQQNALATAMNNLSFSDVVGFCQRLNEPSINGQLVLLCPGNKPSDEPIDGEIIKDLHHYKSHASYVI